MLQDVITSLLACALHALGTVLFVIVIIVLLIVFLYLSPSIFGKRTEEEVPAKYDEPTESEFNSPE